MLEQYGTKIHYVHKTSTQYLVPLPNAHKLSIMQDSRWKGFDIVLINDHGLVNLEMFANLQGFHPNTVAEIEEIILTLQKELA
jgi:hypothetical protein